jgi:hypothetical protein
VFKVTENVAAPLVHGVKAMAVKYGTTAAGSVLVRTIGPAKRAGWLFTYNAWTVTLNGMPAVTDDGVVTTRYEGRS